jgi:hypothetical protein
MAGWLSCRKKAQGSMRLISCGMMMMAVRACVLVLHDAAAVSAAASCTKFSGGREES